MNRALIIVLVCMAGVLVTPVPVSATWGSAFDTPIKMSVDAITQIELRPGLDVAPAISHTKPTWVQRGVFGGWSHPVYNDDNEELFFNLCTPQRWTEDTDIIIHVHCYLPSANDAKNFNLSIAWEHCNANENDTVPDTSNVVFTEMTTGDDEAYTSYALSFTIDYDIDDPNVLIPDENIGFRLYRTAASADEIAGEVVILHAGAVWQRNKMGGEI